MQEHLARWAIQARCRDRDNDHQRVDFLRVPWSLKPIASTPVTEVYGFPDDKCPGLIRAQDENCISYQPTHRMTAKPSKFRRIDLPPQINFLRAPLFPKPSEAGSRIDLATLSQLRAPPTSDHFQAQIRCEPIRIPDFSLDSIPSVLPVGTRTQRFPPFAPSPQATPQPSPGRISIFYLKPRGYLSSQHMVFESPQMCSQRFQSPHNIRTSSAFSCAPVGEIFRFT
jgi:hypothetical protein